MGFFGTIFEPIENLLHVVLQALYNVTDLAGFGSYGVAIILLTILIKMLLYPLTVKQVKSMKAMQELSPKMKKIQMKRSISAAPARMNRPRKISASTMPIMSARC